MDTSYDEKSEYGHYPVSDRGDSLQPVRVHTGTLCHGFSDPGEGCHGCAVEDPVLAVGLYLSLLLLLSVHCKKNTRFLLKTAAELGVAFS